MERFSERARERKEEEEEWRRKQGKNGSNARIELLLWKSAALGLSFSAPPPAPPHLRRFAMLASISFPFLLLLLLVFSASISLLRLSRLFPPFPVFLVDFCCFRPPDHLHLKCSLRHMLHQTIASGIFDLDSLAFIRKVLERSEIGNETYAPPSLMGENLNISMTGSREEAALVLFGALYDLFATTGVRPSQVNGLIVNCSLFGPTPSLASIIVNRFGLRTDIKCFNLSGMGCSAGAVATDLARRLLQVNACSLLVVVSTENITQCGYTGNDRSKLLPNCIFRMGGAAALYTNRSAWRRRCKYELVHTVRTHMGADDVAYRSVYLEEDEVGKVGVTLSKDLKLVAAKAMGEHLRELGAAVLSVGEKAKYAAAAAVGRRHVPDFGRGFEHVCVHAGGKAVIEGIRKSLGLAEGAIEASRMTLYRFGNVSSASIWYELAYEEAKGRVRKGGKVWQLAFGSGFKCNSSVWRCLKTVDAKEAANPWSDFIDSFPVDVPSIQELGGGQSVD